MLYLVEDDANIRELVLYTLNNSGLQAVGFGTPSAFWQAMSEQKPQLIMLDLMLPEEDGLSILRRLRADRATVDIPVMLVTAKDNEYDKVIGFDSGADDYVTKPFGMMELLARVKALLRRTQSHQAEEYTVGKLFVCPDNAIVQVDGADVTLTHKEFSLLCLLLRNRERVLTRDHLLNEIWGYAYDGENRTVDVHVRTLRQKLGEAGDYIETVRGIGYKIGGKSH